MDPQALTVAPPYGDVLEFSLPGAPRVACAFTTALAGNFSLADTCPDKAGTVANRARLLQGLGLRHWVELNQVHGDALLADPQPTNPAEASPLTADGAATRQKGLALAVKTADCQPVLLADKLGTAVAALHVGWRGNAKNFPGTGFIRFCAVYDLDPDRVVALRGPSLGPEAAEFVNFRQEWPERFLPWFKEDSATVDLWDMTRHQLIEAGMRPENIYGVNLCTRSLPEVFFSHRRGDGGRQLSLIWIKPD